jgi:hypothetical protein
VGIPPDPPRAGEARGDDRAVHRLGNAACRGIDPALAGGSGVAAVPARPGRRDHRR